MKPSISFIVSVPRGCGDQRHFDLSVAFDWRSRQPLVGHAHYGAPCCDFCCSHDDTLYKTVIKNGTVKKRIFYTPCCWMWIKGIPKISRPSGRADFLGASLQKAFIHKAVLLFCALVFGRTARRRRDFEFSKTP